MGRFWSKWLAGKELGRGWEVRILVDFGFLGAVIGGGRFGIEGMGGCGGRVTGWGLW